MNYYVQAAGHESLKCSKKQADKLRKLLKPTRSELNDGRDCGLVVEFCPEDAEQLYLYAEENFDYNCLPERFSKEFAKVLKQNKKRYYTIGLSFTSDRCTPQSQGGMDIRLTDKGTIEESVSIWRCDLGVRRAVAAVDNLYTRGILERELSPELAEALRWLSIHLRYEGPKLPDDKSYD